MPQTIPGKRKGLCVWGGGEVICILPQIIPRRNGEGASVLPQMIPTRERGGICTAIDDPDKKEEIGGGGCYLYTDDPGEGHICSTATDDPREKGGRGISVVPQMILGRGGGHILHTQVKGLAMRPKHTCTDTLKEKRFYY